MVAVLAAVFLPAANAQLPDAGQSVRDVESNRLQLPAPVDMDSVQPLPAQPASSEPGVDEERVQVNDFSLEGNHLFGTVELLALLDDLRGKALNLPELNAAAGRISDYYHQHGYVLARAYLPAQEVENGRIQIAVIEGRYGSIDLSNQSRVRDSVLRQPLEDLQPGAVVNGTELERSLLLLSDISGVQARGTLMRGQQPGTTDLKVEARSAPVLSGSVETDNFGDFYTGEYRLGGTLTLNSPLRLGDQLSLRALGSDRHQQYYRMAYQVPIGWRGTRIGIACSQTSYRLVRDFSELDAHGRATIDSLFLSQPLVRSRTFNLNAQLQYEDKALHDDIDLFEQRRRKDIHLWTASLSGSNQDRWLGGGQSAFSLAYGHGRLGIGDPLERYFDRLTAGKEGSFDKLTASLVRLQQLSGRFQLFAQLNAQWSSGNLDSAEQFTLGGPYGIRAFPLGAPRGTGDQGWQATVELRYSFAPAWQLSTFVDQGEVRLNKHPWTPEGNSNDIDLAPDLRTPI
ncbi:MAG: Heme/hemopexin transporter protein HuxB [Pseudomonas sp.]|nr:MAG: Heme/hemopexin transporter protein HuxB [Pseudomonas sp.]